MNGVVPDKKARASLTKGQKPSARGRKVTFCDKGHACQEFQMYSEEECVDVWFSCEDYDNMKSSFEFTVFMMDAGCPEKVEDDEHTTRGLEKRSEEGQWKRYERKRDYYNAVLDEQERQWDEDIDDQDKISQIAQDVTRESLLEAFDQGVLDEIAVHGHSLRLRKQNQVDDIDIVDVDTDADADADTDALTASTDRTLSSSAVSASAHTSSNDSSWHSDDVLEEDSK